MASLALKAALAIACVHAASAFALGPLQLFGLRALGRPATRAWQMKAPSRLLLWHKACSPQDRQKESLLGKKLKEGALRAPRKKDRENKRPIISPWLPPPAAPLLAAASSSTMEIWPSGAPRFAASLSTSAMFRSRFSLSLSLSLYPSLPPSLPPSISLRK